MRTRLMAADHARLQLCIHAIGDAGISQILDLFGDVVGANGERDRRLRIEHAQHIASEGFRSLRTPEVSSRRCSRITRSTMADGRNGASARSASRPPTR